MSNSGASTGGTTVLVPSATAALTNTTPNSLAFQPWGAETVVIAQASCPANAAVIATLTGSMRPGPAPGIVGDRGNYKLQVAFDGVTFADMGTQLSADLESAAGGHGPTLAITRRVVGAVTGNVVVRAQCDDGDTANHVTFVTGVIVAQVAPA